MKGLDNLYFGLLAEGDRAKKKEKIDKTKKADKAKKKPDKKDKADSVVKLKDDTKVPKLKKDHGKTRGTVEIQGDEKEPSLEEIKKEPILAYWLSEKQKNDPSFLAKLLKINGMWIMEAAEKFWTDPKLLKIAIEQNPMVLPAMNAHLEHNSIKIPKALVDLQVGIGPRLLEVAKKEGLVLEQLVEMPELLSKEIVLAAVKENGFAFLSIIAAGKSDYDNPCDKFRHDSEIMSAAVDSAIKEMKKNPELVDSVHGFEDITSTSFKEYRRLILEAVKINPHFLESSTDNQYVNEEIAAAMMAKDPLAYKYIRLAGLREKHYKKARTAALEAVKKDPMAIAELDPVFGRDAEIVMTAVKQNGKAILYADKVFKRDPKYALLAVKQSSGVFSALHNVYHLDKNLIMDLVEYSYELQADGSFKKSKPGDPQILYNLKPPLSKDKDFILDLIELNADVLKWTKLQCDRAFVMQAIKRNPKVVKFSYQEASIYKFGDKRQFHIDAIKANPLAYKYLDDWEQSDDKLPKFSDAELVSLETKAQKALAAKKEARQKLTTKPELKYTEKELSDRAFMETKLAEKLTMQKEIDFTKKSKFAGMGTLWRNDEQMALFAIKHNPLAYRDVGEVLKADPDFKYQALAVNGLVLGLLDKADQANEGLIFEAVPQNGLAIRYMDYKTILEKAKKEEESKLEKNLKAKDKKRIMEYLITRRLTTLEEVALKQNPASMQFFKYLNRNQSIVLEEIKKNPDMARFAHEDLKKSEDFAKRVSHKDKTGKAFAYMDSTIRGSKKFFEENIQYNGKMLLHATDELKADVKWIEEKLLMETAYIYPYLPRAMKDDTGVTKRFIARSAYAIHVIDKKYRKDWEYIKLGLKHKERLSREDQQGGCGHAPDGKDKYYSIMKFASPEIQKNPVYMKEAIKLNGFALEFASDELKGDRVTVLSAVKENGLALQFASKNLRADKELVRAALKEDNEAIFHVSDELMKDQAFLKEMLAEHEGLNNMVSSKYLGAIYEEKVKAGDLSVFKDESMPVEIIIKYKDKLLEAIKKDWKVIYSMSVGEALDQMKDDARKYYLEVVRGNGLELENRVPKKYRKDPEFLKLARDDYLKELRETTRKVHYFHLPWAYRADRAFVYAAIEGEPAIYAQLDKKIKENPLVKGFAFEIYEKALKKPLKKGEALRDRYLKIPVELRDDKDLALFVLERDGNLLIEMSDELTEDPELVLAAYKQNPASYEYASFLLKKDPKFIKQLDALKKRLNAQAR